MFFGNALIGLREGLEAGLVVMTLAGFLSSRGRHRQTRVVWAAVAIGIVACVLAGMALAFTAAQLSGQAENVFEMIACAIAITFITAMIFWMRHSQPAEREELEGKLSKALRGGPVAVLTITFLTIAREGVEASVFVIVLSHGGGPALSITGLVAGVGIAVTLVGMLHAGVVRIDMRRFLNITGGLLAIIGAGIAAHLVTAMQNLGLLPGGTTIAFDASAIMPVGSWRGEFIDGLSGISARPTVLAVVAWTTYIVAVLVVFRRAMHLPSARQPLEMVSVDR